MWFNRAIFKKWKTLLYVNDSYLARDNILMQNHTLSYRMVIIIEKVENFYKAGTIL